MAVIYDKESGKFYGVAEEAKKLNVTRSHLYYCLKGTRKLGKKHEGKLVIKEV